MRNAWRRAGFRKTAQGDWCLYWGRPFKFLEYKELGPFQKARPPHCFCCCYIIFIIIVIIILFIIFFFFFTTACRAHRCEPALRSGARHPARRPLSRPQGMLPPRGATG